MVKVRRRGGGAGQGRGGASSLDPLVRELLTSESGSVAAPTKVTGAPNPAVWVAPAIVTVGGLPIGASLAVTHLFLGLEVLVGQLRLEGLEVREGQRRLRARPGRGPVHAAKLTPTRTQIASRETRFPVMGL